MKNREGKDNAFWKMKKSDDGKSGEIFIYGEITKYAWEEYGEKSAKIFQEELEELGDVDVIHLYVNSPGGSVFEGISIHNMLKRHPARVIAHVDALAASIASVIIMAADEIRMPSNSMLMIHWPWTWIVGNSAKLRKEADNLDRIGEAVIQSYLDKAGDKLDEGKLREMLDAETWLLAEEAFQYGLCDAVDEENQAAACVSDELFAKYKNVPESLKNYLSSSSKPHNKQKELIDREKIIQQTIIEIQNLKSYLGGIIQ